MTTMIITTTMINDDEEDADDNYCDYYSNDYYERRFSCNVGCRTHKKEFRCTFVESEGNLYTCLLYNYFLARVWLSQVPYQLATLVINFLTLQLLYIFV